MFPRVTRVAVIAPYGLDIGFADGSSGIVDCSHLILGENPGVFAQLRDPAEFAKAYVHPEARTVAWPHDLDLDPDVLYARAHAIPIPDQ
jgi:hypothetical protein